MEAFDLLHEVVFRYEELDQLGAKLEQMVIQNKVDGIGELYDRIRQRQEQAGMLDTRLMEIFVSRPELRDYPQIRKWLQLMKNIHTRNQYLLPQLQTRLAHHRSELGTLHKGVSLLQGYRLKPRPVGALLSSAG
ncbi:MAG: hypothetical protein GXY53_10405 [Desulfobulbus sp.]|nr:hypothetical protein [Desulfobulbus sp.]